MTDTLPPPEPADGGDEPRWDPGDEPRWDPGDETATPEPEVDPATPPLEFDDDTAADDDIPTGDDPTVDEVYAQQQQVLSPGLNGSPFVVEDQGPGGSGEFS